MRRRARRSAGLLLALAMLAACAPPPGASAPSNATSPVTSKSAETTLLGADDAAFEAAIEEAISTGPSGSDNVRAVLAERNGAVKLAHYRRGFAEEDHGHVWSVTKSVLSTLIGMAIADGVIADLDQPLTRLLPEHRKAMRGDTARVSLRHLMTMSGGFPGSLRDEAKFWQKEESGRGSYVDRLLERRRSVPPGTAFEYSNFSADLAAAVLAAALARSDRPRTVLGYAQARLFDPLGIRTEPAFSRPLPDPYAAEFQAAGFGWGTNPNGVPLGGYGLRLTAPDMIKIGALYRGDGMWNGKRLLPSGWVKEATSSSELNPKYGLLWWIVDQAGYGAVGFGGQRIFVVPHSGAVMAILSSTPRGAQEDLDTSNLEQVLLTALR